MVRPSLTRASKQVVQLLAMVVLAAVIASIVVGLIVRASVEKAAAERDRVPTRTEEQARNDLAAELARILRQPALTLTCGDSNTSLRAEIEVPSLTVERVRALLTQGGWLEEPVRPGFGSAFRFRKQGAGTIFGAHILTEERKAPHLVLVEQGSEACVDAYD
jgi:hypothetical protein